jgi:hypothetical protein
MADPSQTGVLGTAQLRVSMNNSAQPKSPLLSARDLYAMPSAAEAFVGMLVGHGRLPFRLHFTLADGREFHLPISDIALRQLAIALAALRPGREPISDRATSHNAGRSIETALGDARALPPK